MKKLILFLILLVSIDYDSFSNEWEEIKDFPTITDGAFSFVIEGKAYINGGLASNKFGTYDKDQNQWIQLADIPGEGDHLAWAFSFVIDGKGYVAGGSFGDAADLTNKVLMYDPATDIWTEKKPLPIFRDAGFSFSLNGKGYIGGGFDGQFVNADLWEYDPISDIWTQVSIYPGGPVIFPTYFTINNQGKQKAYIGLGGDGGTNETNQFWEYNGIDNSWKQISSFPGALRQTAIGYSIGNNGFVGGGMTKYTTNIKDFWKYDSENDAWSLIEDFDLPTDYTAWSTGFILENEIYFGLGVRFPDFSFSQKFYKRDFSIPSSIEKEVSFNQQNYINSWIENNDLNLDLTSMDIQEVEINSLKICNSIGLIISNIETNELTNYSKINISNLSKGSYYIILNSNKKQYYSKFIK